MPKYNKTRNRKRKKTKQINKRTRKQSVRGKTMKYKRSRQLGGAGLSGISEIRLKGLPDYIFTRDRYKNVMIIKKKHALWSLYLSAVPTTHPQNLELTTFGGRTTLMINTVSPSEVKVNLDDDTGSAGTFPLLLWPLMRSLVTVKCEDRGIAIRSINDVRKYSLREAIEEISNGRPTTEIRHVEAESAGGESVAAEAESAEAESAKAAAEAGTVGEEAESAGAEAAKAVAGAGTVGAGTESAEAEAAKAAAAGTVGSGTESGEVATQQGGAWLFSRPVTGSNDTIRVSDDKIEAIMEYCLARYGIKPDLDKKNGGGPQMGGGETQINLDDLIQKLGILEESSYRYGDTPYCDSCPGQYKYYMINSVPYTFDQVASALDKITDVPHQKYNDAIVSVQNLDKGLEAQADKSGEPPFRRKTTEEQKQITNCELCNNGISDAIYKTSLWKRKICVQCDYVVCKACCDQKTCNRCDLRMFMSQN